MDRPGQGRELVKPGLPCCPTGVRVLGITCKKGRDAPVGSNALGFLQTVRPNASLQESPNAHIKAPGGSTCVGEHLVVKGTSQVGVGVKLHHGQFRKVPVDGRMIASSVHDRRQDAVLASQKQRKEVTLEERGSMGRQLVQLSSKRWGRALPNGFC